VQDPITTSEINVGGTLNVLLTARDEGVRRVVFASSSSIYGDAPGLPRTERQAPMPPAPYAVSKLAAEQYCRVFAMVYGWRRCRFATSTCSASVRTRLAIQRRDSALHHGHAGGTSPDDLRSGEQSRDFTHIDDVVAANLLAIQAAAVSGGVFNIACGTHHSLNELVVSLNQLLDTDVQPIHISPRPGDVELSWADIGRAREALGYEPEVDFEQGLRRTLAAYNEDLPVPRSAAFGG
jgi:nucleoside-diphosphate-sugar epimerase